MTAAIELQQHIFQNENTQAIAEMNTLYQLQAKDNSIKNLNENIKVSQLKLERNRLFLIIAVLAVLLLLIFFILFYSIYKQRQLKEEKEKVQLQQQLLRTQMEPHFIFNTLAALQSFIRLDKKDTAIKYLGQFSQLLRSSLELSRETVVPLSEEIAALQTYLSLQQMRCDYRFQFTIQSPAQEGLDAVMIPPMLIQPFAENAILHGIDLQDTNAFVHINFDLGEDLLKVTITDSGTKTPEIIQAHQSLSGTISRERLQLLSRERQQQAGVTYSKTNSGGTSVVITIPVTDAD